MSDHEPRIGAPGAQRDYTQAGTDSDNDPTLAAGGDYGPMPDSADAGDQMLGSPKGGGESTAGDTGPGRYGGESAAAGALESGTEHPSAVRTGGGETPSTDRADAMSAAQTRDAEHYGQHHHEGHHGHHHPEQTQGQGGGEVH